jgi:glycosyltransferase involved in cell wall biosynthesis
MGKINEAISVNGLANRVVMVGYTPYPQTPIAYQISNIFVLPSSWEGLPKVVMQGLSCGVPCLVSGFRLSENIQGLYYLKNLDPEYIAKSIYGLIEGNYTSVDTKKVALLYSWDARVKEIQKVYEFARKNYLV